MPRKAQTPQCISASPPCLRRSSRIRAQQQIRPLEASCKPPRSVKPLQDAMRNIHITDSVQGKKRKLRNTQENQKDQPPAKKPTPPPPSPPPAARTHVTTDSMRPRKTGKRAVHFEDGELEPIVATPSPMERAQAVSVEYLASQAAKSNEPESDIRKVACPEEAQPRLEPIRIEGRKGDYLRYPPIFILAYPYPITSIFQHLQARGRDVEGDIGLTLAALRKRVQAELGMEEGSGFVKSTSDEGCTAYVFVASWSDRPETLPYPEARIRKIQEILMVKDLPSVLPYRRKNKRL